MGPKGLIRGKFVMLKVLWLWIGMPEQNHETLL